jgi:hypothetical protein
MNSTDVSEMTAIAQSRSPNLALHYGKIGISAVAAALRYHGDPNADPYAAIAVPPGSDVLDREGVRTTMHLT